MTAAALRLEYLPLSKLRPAARNPKRHASAEIAQSYERFGYVAPMILDESTGRLAAGHGRLEELVRAKAAGASPPARIRVRGREWWVPVIRGVRFSSQTEREAYLLADNQLTIAGGWESAELRELLRELAQADALAGVGFSQKELARALAPGAAAEDAPLEEALRLQGKWGTARGQLWVAGGHRLYCGDSTVAADVDRLLEGARPLLMVTDPPYGVEYDPGWRAVVSGATPRRRGKVRNDDLVDWREAWALSPATVVYCWHAGIHAARVQTSLEAAGYEIRAQIVWVKPQLVISRGHYHWRHEPCWYGVRREASHEPCWYGVKKGAAGEWIGDRKQTTAWEIEHDETAEGGHGTQKPVACMAIPLANHAGDVYDPFLGSGTTLVAAEQLGRRGYGMELDPLYVAIALERLEKLGVTATQAA